jgi:hypothetical protein
LIYKQQPTINLHQAIRLTENQHNPNTSKWINEASKTNTHGVSQSDNTQPKYQTIISRSSHNKNFISEN